MRTLKTLILPLLLIASMVGFDTLRVLGERAFGELIASGLLFVR